MRKREVLFNKYFQKGKSNLASEVLTFIDEDIQKALHRAYELNSITDADVVNKPILIKTPDNFYENGAVSVAFDEKRTEVVYDQSLFTALFLNKKTLFYYQSNIDHKIGEINYDVAGEIALDTIVNVQTVFSYSDVGDNELLLDLELSTADGTTFNIRLRNQFFGKEGSTNQPLLSDSEKAVLSQIKEAIRNVY